MTKYFANWGDEQITYKYEGYKDEKLVKTIVRTAVTSVDYTVKADCTTLTEADTYDVTRIELCAVDQNGNRLPYCSDIVKVSVSGPAKVIGPTCFPLVGGAFWVKSDGKSGKARVRVTFRDSVTKSLTLDVIKK